MQEQMNSMNDSGEFQEVESNYSGRLSYVSSQPAMIPSSRSMQSCDKRLPLDTWNTSGERQNVLGNQFSTFDSLHNHYQGIHYSTTPSAIESVTGRLAQEMKIEKGHNSNADICKKAVDCEFFHTGRCSAEFCGWTAKTADIGTAT